MDESPKISPDSQKIAFLSGEFQQRKVHIMDLNAENQHPVTTEGGEIGVEWSEDGRILVAAWDRGNQGCCNFDMEPDGSNIMQAGGKGEMQKYLPFRTLDGNKEECSGWRIWKISLCGIPNCHEKQFLRMDSEN